MKLADRSENHQTFNFGQTLLFEARNQRKRNRTQAELYNAGCALLNRVSPASLKVSEICDEAGVAHGTFYIYFPNRQTFVANLLLHFVDFLQIAMHRASKAQDKDTVRATMRAYYQLFEQNTGMMKCLINNLEEFPSSQLAFHKLNREWATIIVTSSEKKLAHSGRAGKISRDELYRRAYALGGMVDQYLSAHLLNRDPFLNNISQDRQAVIETLCLIWKRGMAE